MPPLSASRASPSGSTNRPAASRTRRARPMAREGGAGHGGAVPPERLDSAARGCGVRQSHIPGALSILKGAVPDRARGLGHMAPTYFRREPGIATLAAIAAPHSRLRVMMPQSPAVDDLKAALRREALARREALPTEIRTAAGKS